VLSKPVCGIVLGGSSLSLSNRVQMRSLAHATAMVTRFPDVPCLGVCFGMQVLAALHGGVVEAMDRGSNGWLPVTELASGRSRPRYCNHHDAVTTLPPGFTASHVDKNGTTMGMVGPLHGRLVVGLQFHPEADDADEVYAFVHARIAGRGRARL
jgi:GMP synthase-like glutamine amidotransferase